MPTVTQHDIFWWAKPTLRRDGLKNAADLAKIRDISLFGLLRNLIKPADRRRFETRFRRNVFGVNDLDLHLDGKIAALNPLFSFFSSLGHDHQSRK